LTADSLRKLTQHDTALKHCQPHVTTVELYFQGFIDPNVLMRLEFGVMPGDEDATIIFEWTTQLNSAITSLAAMLQQCPGLRSLKLKTKAEEPELDRLRQGYLMSKPLADLLSLSQLTSLELDTVDSYPMSHEDVHLCRSINSLLPSLKRLRCRMDSICESLLDLREHDTLLDIEEVILNLSVADGSPTWMGRTLPSRCHHVPDESDWQVTEDILAQATILCHRLRNPRIVRIIAHERRTYDLYAFDAITGDRIYLLSHAMWDVDATVVRKQRPMVLN
jgi:hypothetical protein